MLYNNDKFIAIIKGRLSENRFVHSLNVADAAVLLAEKYGNSVQIYFRKRRKTYKAGNA